MPEYPNAYGCAPSSGAMILGYWDGRGLTDLIPGDPMPYRDEIRQIIASDRHLADYWVRWNSRAQDPWMTEGRLRPFDTDCLADLMFTSRYPTPDGWTNPD